MPADGQIDYRDYGDVQLREALGNIDVHAYPLNYANLTGEMSRRGLPLEAADPVDPFPEWKAPKLAPRDPSTPYTPNVIPAKVRVYHIVSASIVIVSGAVGLWWDDMFIVGRHPHRVHIEGARGAHLHGMAALVMYMAMLAAAASLLSVVVDHYDRRDNERHYRAFAMFANLTAFGLALAAMAIAMSRNESS